jgi:hypothetical protein
MAIYGNVRLTFYVTGKVAVMLSLAKDSGLRIDFSGRPTKNSGEIEPPKNGNPPKDLIKVFDNAFAEVFE